MRPSASPRTRITASPVCSRSVEANRSSWSVSSSRVPPSTGRVGRVETVRLTQATASAKESRSVVNFTVSTSTGYPQVLVLVGWENNNIE